MGSSRWHLPGLILASALITFDGTATTVALPSIGRDLGASIARLQWIANAPLLVLAALLVPAGSFADRFGRVRVLRLGLFVFALGSIGCLLSASHVHLIVAKFAQGSGAALILPAVLALLRGGFRDDGERTRVLGIWAAWTGAASAAGPLLAGAFVDLWSWRLIFIVSSLTAGTAALMIRNDAPAAEPARRGPAPALSALALMLLLGSVSYLLMQASADRIRGMHIAVPVVVVAISAVVLFRDPARQMLLPRELVTSRNCMPANLSTFALYFGMFGLSFVVVLYVQQVLRHSAFIAALVLLPMSVMLWGAERFGRLTTRLGTRVMVAAGAIAAAAGIGWMAAGPHPLPMWSHLIPGTAMFGLGVSVAVSAVTHAAVVAVPASCAGAASGLNHAVVRAAGLTAVALLGSIAAPGMSDAVSAEGVQRALTICAILVCVVGVGGSLLLRDEEPGGLTTAA